MFSSLKFRLWASFATVILVCLLIAGSAFSVTVQYYNAERATQRLAHLALPIALQVNVLERAGASSQVMSVFLQDQAEQIGVRILLVDSTGLVIGDTAGNLTGQTLDVRRNETVGSKWNQMMSVGQLSTPDHTELYYVLANPTMGRSPAQSFVVGTPSYRVILAMPEADVGTAWLAVAPGLSLAAILSLVVSIGLAVVLARSIAGPITKITHASEAMARGDYQHNITAQGRDEVARLAQSFNEMAKQVGATNQTLREFLANASHELKTPLTSIQGFSQAMVDGAISEPREYAQAAGIINAEAARMRNLVDDLLLLSRMEAGQVALDRESLDLGDLLATCLERFRWRADEQGIELALNVSPNFGLVSGDSGRLEQVFGNLLDNAFRYAPAGGTVTVRAAIAPTDVVPPESLSGMVAGTRRVDQRWVRVQVHNTGSWITPDELAHVFERFYRSRGRPDSSTEGSGLGLAIVQEIVEAHDGWVVVRSDQQTGTEFEVTLPALPEDGAGSVANRRKGSGVTQYSLPRWLKRGSDEGTRK